jgi:NADP-dependent aldehyde dehydrogenase
MSRAAVCREGVVSGGAEMLASINPRTGEQGPAVEACAIEDVAAAARRAGAIAPVWAATPARERARVLRAVVEALEAVRPEIVRIADFETGLGEPRFHSELNRTQLQLGTFADIVERGVHVEAILVSGDPGATPPRPDLRRMLIPLGPVGVFSPSNFPVAYGVLGGDSASALAAGCPIVVKGHPSHPRTSAICARAFADAAAATGAPSDILLLLQSGDPAVSRAVVSAPQIQAVGFTGSQAVGRLLFDVAAARPEPIPFYGELGSINPLFIGEAAAAARPDAIAEGYIGSMTMGYGQFCTKPGVVFVPTGAAGDRVVAAMTARIATQDASVLLNAGLRETLATKVANTAAVKGVRAVAEPCAVPDVGVHVAPRLFVTDEHTFFAHDELRFEHFGPVAIIVRTDAARMPEAASHFDGQLTGTIHADAGDEAWVRRLLPILTKKVGRLIYNGYPTGLAVVAAMNHGGPYPASTSSLHSSVGATAIRRFLRPVAYQAVPDALLPPELQDANPLHIPRQRDGRWEA